jgi:hypothetical protein
MVNTVHLAAISLALSISLGVLIKSKHEKTTPRNKVYERKIPGR